MKQTLLSILLLSSTAFAATAATGTLSQKTLSLDLADKLAQNVIQACAKDNYTISVTVVDRSGTPLVMKRMDNAGPHTLEASRMKAFTSLTTKNPTENVMKGAQSNPEAASLRDIPGFLLLAGGIPVKSGDRCCRRWRRAGRTSGSGMRTAGTRNNQNCAECQLISHIAEIVMDS